MANEDLVNFRNQLSSDFSGLWDGLEDVINSMKREFDESDRSKFRECTNSDTLPEGNNIEECLEAMAAELGVAESFRRQLNSAPDLVSNLRSMGRSAAQANNVSDAVRSSADFTKVSTLNRLCSKAQYSDVEDEVSDESMSLAGVSSIGNYRDCVTVTSEEAGLREDLRTAYGTN